MGRWQERQARREVNASYKTSGRMLKEALGREAKVSHGTVYLEGRPFSAYLTQTRLIWNRMQEPVVDGFTFADVHRFARAFHTFHVELKDGRQFHRLEYLPSDVMGPGVEAQRNYVDTVMVQNMTLLGAEKVLVDAFSL